MGRPDVGQSWPRIHHLLTGPGGDTPGELGGPLHRDLLGEHGPKSELTGVETPRHPPPRRSAPQRPQNRICAQHMADRIRVGVEVEQRPTPRDGRGQVARIGEPQRGIDVGRLRGERGDAEAVGEAHGGAVRPSAPLLDPRCRGRREMPEQVVDDEGLAAGETYADDSHRAPRHRRPGVPNPLAKRPGRGGIHLRDGLVEAPHRGESCGEGHIAHGHGSGFDEEAGGVGPLRPRKSGRPGTQLGVHQPLQLPLRIAEPRRKARHAVPIDNPVADQSHGPGDDIAADVPFGTARARVRPAAAAGPIARRDGRSRTGMERHVLIPGRDCRATRAAIDPRRLHRVDEDAVEPVVPAAHGPQAGLPIWHHPTIITRPTRPFWRKSDIDVPAEHLTAAASPARPPA